MTTIPPRRLGATDVRLGPIALGCYSMSSTYGPRDDADSRAVINAAIDRGVSMIDTADYYGWGHNEELIRSAIATRRDEVLLSTKFGYVKADGVPFGIRGDAAYVREACDRSLRRLGTDRIDLYYQHRLDPQVPVEETVGAMADLVTAGKVRFLGLCEVSASTLQRATAVHPIAAVQIEYSLWTREAEDGLLAAFREADVTPMAFSPLARGMLTGALRSRDQLGPTDARLQSPRFSPENFPKNVQLVDRLRDMADRMGCSLPQLALAWLLHKAPEMVAVCGCDTLPYLAENLGALDVELDNEAVAAISAMFAPGTVAGDRYHPIIMKMLDR